MAGKPEVADTCLDMLLNSIVELLWDPVTGSAHPEKTLEKMGFQVGVKLIERYTKDRPKFNEDLEAVTFLCKDFWNEVFRKPIDKLRTNHKVPLAPPPYPPLRVCTNFKTSSTPPPSLYCPSIPHPPDSANSSVSPLPQ
jgi:hypothetical protein